MKMKIQVLRKSDYGFHLKGSRALNLMMDNETPPIDLLVRESIQNSADAVRQDKKFCSISYKLNEFANLDLANVLEGAGNSLRSIYGNTRRVVLAITDRNTTGLLGAHYEDVGNPNNFYKLVYSFLESGKDDDSGGSWGIGKSVYYRFGIGLVFYYSRTYENNRYKHKLAGAIIENEESSHALLKQYSSSLGIAFFGEEGEGLNGSIRSIPVTNEDEIAEFLDIFNLRPFVDDETGTIIIMPYFNCEKTISKKNYEENVYWDNNFDLSLSMSIQRWYFSRLNNEKYNGKYIRVRVNDKPVSLNPFFQTMQELYNGDIEDAGKFSVSQSALNQELGFFHYKVFDKSELKVLTQPDNLPSPYALLDINKSEENEENEAIIFYLRKPGMTITYNDSRMFTSLKTKENEYLIGVFVLNDDSSYRNEKVGSYFKEGEKANHGLWRDYSTSPKIKEIITLRSKPFKVIRNQINKELNSKFGNQVIEETTSTNSALQKKLGEMLLPPEDFGKEPTIKRKKTSAKPPLSDLKKEKRVLPLFNGFINGKPSYTFQVFLKPEEQYSCKILVKTTTKKYTLEDWDSFDFVAPCYFSSITVDGYQLNKMNFNLLFNISLAKDDGTRPFIKYDGNRDPIFKITTVTTPVSKKICGFKLTNPSSDELRMSFNILLEPVDETSEFVFSNSISRIGGEG